MMPAMMSTTVMSSKSATLMMVVVLMVLMMMVAMLIKFFSAPEWPFAKQERHRAKEPRPRTIIAVATSPTTPSQKRHQNEENAPNYNEQRQTS